MKEISIIRDFFGLHFMASHVNIQGTLMEYLKHVSKRFIKKKPDFVSKRLKL